MAFQASIEDLIFSNGNVSFGAVFSIPWRHFPLPWAHSTGSEGCCASSEVFVVVTSE